MVVSIVIVAIFFEILIRIFLIGPSNHVFDAETGFRYAPNSEIFTGREGFSRNQVNSLGLNNDELVGKTKPRMLVIGDSYAEGRHVDREKNFVSLVNARSANWEFINAGREGLHLSAANILVGRLGKELDIDAVLLVMSSGDIVNDLSEGGYEVIRRDGGIQVRPRLSAQESLKEFFTTFLNHSALLTYAALQLKKVLRHDAAPEGGSAPANYESLDFEKRRLLFRAIVQELKSQYNVYVVYLHQIEYLSGERAVANENSKFIESKLSKWSEELGLEYENSLPDLLRIYHAEKFPPYGFMNSFPGSGHLNELGHKALADTIYRMTK